MLRLCVRNVWAQNKTVLQPVLFKDIGANLKCLGVSQKQYFGTKKKNKEIESLEKIYYGPLTPQIKTVKVFSLTSSVAGLLAQPIIIREAAALESTSLLVALCSVVGFFTFVTPLLLHLVTKKYVTEIHYDPKTSTYKATTINFFLAEKRTDFKVDDVVVPEIPGMFTTMTAKGKPLFIEARHFTDPRHYAKIMGYDKPMDFKLGDDPQDTTQ
ncbi:transmembrane protein 70 homolog, mitochondrial [Pectinophora gossypiella]|uniref:transmembrane protein 70 homolog, mitochondrial n=1 Tax=Pectinophora gossypiella TaxID=13191 RepID=UPI00214EAE4E|nr:transmembrane protein 70 homolog, mitochondrial [Pectinophora gossypiella]